MGSRRALCMSIIRLLPTDPGDHGEVEKIPVEGCQIAAIILPAQDSFAQQFDGRGAVVFIDLSTARP